MERLFFVLGALSGALAVAAGAFAAHVLRGSLPQGQLDLFETAVRYQFYHAVGLLVVSVAMRSLGMGLGAIVAGWLFVAGTVLFAGSLYLLSVTGLRWLGAITPFGGLAFILGWLVLAVSALRG